MIKSQVVVLNVMYDDGEESTSEVEGPKDPPAEWDWSTLVDEPIRNAVEVLAAGPLKAYPRLGEEE